MPKETQTTLYPSQINTKTIACRISAQDYVTFLNEAITKGITINDWLLMKIYDSHIGNTPLNVDESFFKGDLQEVYESVRKTDIENQKSERWSFEIDNYIQECIEINNIKPESKDGLIIILEQLLRDVNSINKSANVNAIQSMDLQEQLDMKNSNKPNLTDIKAQILTLSQAKFRDRKMLKDFMFDVNELLAELG